MSFIYLYLFQHLIQSKCSIISDSFDVTFSLLHLLRNKTGFFLTAQNIFKCKICWLFHKLLISRSEQNMSQSKRYSEHHCLVIHIQTLPRPSPSDLVILEAHVLSRSSPVGAPCFSLCTGLILRQSCFSLSTFFCSVFQSLSQP